MPFLQVQIRVHLLTRKPVVPARVIITNHQYIHINT